MQYADLHIHSNFSDGIYTPREILKMAEELHIKYISVTDHDNIKAQEVLLKEAYNFNVNIISGTEISTEYEGYEVHVLGYFIDINNIKLNALLDKLKFARIQRVHDTIVKLKELNINVSFEEIETINNLNTIGRAHIANLLVSKGYTNSFKEAFHSYLAKDKQAYVERYKVHYKEALSVIRESGGIPVLAHPGKTYKSIFMEKLIKDFKSYGLLGIEVFHPSHTIKQSNSFYNYAKKYNLLITGGSDFHGTPASSNISIGSSGISEELLSNIIKYKSKMGEIK